MLRFHPLLPFAFSMVSAFKAALLLYELSQYPLLSLPVSLLPSLVPYLAFRAPFSHPLYTCEHIHDVVRNGPALNKHCLKTCLPREYE